MTPRYPVLVDLAGRPCVVVGGGRVAERKVSGLLAAGAAVTLVAPSATPAIERWGADGELRWLPRPYGIDLFESAGPAEGRWWLAVAATDDAEVNRAVATDAARAGVWANEVTAADGGPVALPAVHRQGPLTLAVSTGGIHPGAARWLRDVAAAAIGPEHLTALALADEVRAESPSGDRPDWRAAVDSGMLDLIREGRVAEAKERLQACLSSSSD